MDEGRPSNWNASNIENLTNVNNQNQQRQNSIRNLVAQHRRKRHDIAVAAVVAFIVFLTLEPGMSMHNIILLGWLKVEEYLQGHLRRIFNRVRMTPHVFIALCMLLKQRDLLADSRGLAVEEQLFMFLTIISQSKNSRATQDDFNTQGKLSPVISQQF